MSHKVYVGNLPYSFTAEDLKSLFGAYGAVRSAEVISDRETGRSRGFGFVEMETAEQIQEAIKGLHDNDVQGRRLTVNEARERAPRAFGGPRPGGGGFSGPRPGGGGFGGPRPGGPAGGGPGARPERNFGPPRPPGGGWTPGRGQKPSGRPKRDEGDRWSDGGGRRRRHDEFGDDEA